jgi:uncharacterized Fe-S cluster-containing radical SAM superfamily protein
MFDPIKLAHLTKEIVCRDSQRKYYRFRPSRFYGGISTADCVGCCLRCVFCWAWNVVINPTGTGDFYSPDDVAIKIMRIAEKKSYNQIRISGNEPTIGMEHTIKVIENLKKDYLFILETNGILIGQDEEYAKVLSRFKNVHVRVSLKGTSNEEFSILTGSIPEGFDLQIRSIVNLMRYGVSVHAACMISFSTLENVNKLRSRLREIHPSLEEFETEELILYPHIEERLKKLNVKYYTAYKPDRIPPEQI